MGCQRETKSPWCAKHIALVIPELSAGGAERVALRMANYWTNEGRQVSLFTFDDGQEEPFYELEEAVSHQPLDIADVSTTFLERITNNIGRVQRLRSALTQASPDVVIAFMPPANVLTVWSGIGADWPVIVSEHNNPEVYPLGSIWDTLRHWTYPLADALVGVSKPIVQFFSDSVQNGRVIHNPVVPDKEEIGDIPDPEDRVSVICAMGSLTHQKGFDILLRAFAQIKDQHPNWTIEIWGEGEHRARLEALRDRLALEERVRLPGLTKKPFEKMKRASFFVLSSRYEGFGNVLAEALACGSPVVSFDCPSGPSEIVRPGIDGELIPTEDAGALAEAMHIMIEDSERRHNYARRAPEVRERLGKEVIMQEWSELIANACRT